jgi:hypothetical protein
MTSGWLDKTREYKALLTSWCRSCRTAGCSRARRSGGDLLVEAEVLFDGGDADFELKAFVDFALFELGELGVEEVDAVFGRHLSANICDVVFGRHLRRLSSIW